jgi:hypothetical protein
MAQTTPPRPEVLAVKVLFSLGGAESETSCTCSPACRAAPPPQENWNKRPVHSMVAYPGMICVIRVMWISFSAE